MLVRPRVSIQRHQAHVWVVQCLVGLACLVVSACGASAGRTVGGTPMSTTPPMQAVSLTTDQASYSPTSTVNVTLANRRQASVFSTDHQSLCAVVTLQRQVDNEWVAQRQCRLMSPTRIVEVAVGTTQITLAPGDTPWPTGAYRVVFHYVVSRQDDMGNGLSVASPIFTVA